MMRVATSMEACTEFVFIHGGLSTTKRYIEEVMVYHVVPFAQLFVADFVVMQDVARPIPRDPSLNT